MLKNVLLPDPLGPMIEMYSPRLIVMVTPFSAFTSVSPIWYERFTSMVRTVYSERAEVGAGVVVAVSVMRGSMGSLARLAHRIIVHSIIELRRHLSTRIASIDVPHVYRRYTADRGARLP